MRQRANVSSRGCELATIKITSVASSYEDYEVQGEEAQSIPDWSATLTCRGIRWGTNHTTLLLAGHSHYKTSAHTQNFHKARLINLDG